MIVLKYVGDAFLPGVPAKDLTQEEINKTPYTVDQLLRSKLYVKYEPPESKPVPSSTKLHKGPSENK